MHATTFASHRLPLGDETRPLVSVGQLLPAHRLLAVAKTVILVALGVYLAGGQFERAGVWLTLLLGGLLWACLYALNEFTDLVAERGYRPQRSLGLLLVAAPLLVSVAAGSLSPTLLALFLAMIAGQMVYSVSPLRLKRFWWANPLLSGIINPVLRFQCGVLWGTHPVLWPAYGAVVCLHLGAALRARVLQRERDRGLGYSAAPSAVNGVGLVLVMLGFGAMFLLYLEGALPAPVMLATVGAMVFAAYAWSGHVNDIRQVRAGWLGFAVLALISFFILLTVR